MGSLAVLVFGLMLAGAGYESGVTVTPEMQNKVFLSITLIPAVSCLISIVPFLFYKIPAEKNWKEHIARLSYREPGDCYMKGIRRRLLLMEPGDCYYKGSPIAAVTDGAGRAVIIKGVRTAAVL